VVPLVNADEGATPHRIAEVGLLILRTVIPVNPTNSY
jgi:hypothetical protein